VSVRQKGLRFVDRGDRVLLRLVGPWEKDPLEDVRDACRVDTCLEKLLYQSVQSARAAGYSWADIGKAMGTTKQPGSGSANLSAGVGGRHGTMGSAGTARKEKDSDTPSHPDPCYRSLARGSRDADFRAAGEDRFRCACSPDC
jgi:hypothetical protein